MTDEITVRLKDLKNLGKQGGATARLEDGTDLILKPDYAVKQARGYVDGLLRDVEFHLPYKKVYDQIRTIDILTRAIQNRFDWFRRCWRCCCNRV